MDLNQDTTQDTNQKITVELLMTKNVIAVNPETPLVKAVDVLVQNNFSGLPVVDKDNKLVGILTDYDLIIKGSSIHLPTFVKLLQQFEIYQKDKSMVKKDIKAILNMTVEDVMNNEPLTLHKDASLEEVTKTFSEHHRVNPIPVIDHEKKLVGIISRYDLVKLMGAPSANIKAYPSERELDKAMNQFLSAFENEFILVSRHRAQNWLLYSLIFILVGFVIAVALLVRFKY